MNNHRKQEIITFKVDDALSEALKGVSNRSEFIRKAILSAMENVCPLCMGTGIMQPHQRKHWEAFMESHSLERCTDCESMHLVCPEEKKNTL